MKGKLVYKHLYVHLRSQSLSSCFLISLSLFWFCHTHFASCSDIILSFEKCWTCVLCDCEIVKSLSISITTKKHIAFLRFIFKKCKTHHLALEFGLLRCFATHSFAYLRILCFDLSVGFYFRAYRFHGCPSRTKWAQKSLKPNFMASNTRVSSLNFVTIDSEVGLEW